MSGPVSPLPLLQLPVQPGQGELVGVLLGEQGPGDLLRGLLVELCLAHQVDLLVFRPAGRHRGQPQITLSTPKEVTLFSRNIEELSGFRNTFILAIFVVYREWVNLATVGAWHFYEHLYCTDSDILSLLFLLTNVLIVSCFG